MTLAEIDIWRSAQLMIRRYGDDAWLEAAQKADAALADGRTDAFNAWKRITAAVTELQRKKPNGYTC